MPTPSETQQKTLDWYTELAAHPAWKAHVWHQVNQLARDHPSLFGDLPELLTERMKSSGAQKSSGV